MSLTPREPTQNHEWMVVYITYSIPEAHIVAGRLQHEGIPAMVHAQAGASALGIVVGSLGEVTVLVKPEDYDAALDILEMDEPAPLEDNYADIIYRPIEQDEDDE